MTISRRVLLKQLAIASAAIALAPSLVGCASKPSLSFKHIAVTEDEEELLKLIAAIIVPKTTTPGAADVATHAYTVKMLDDCMSKEDQEKWLNGLHQFIEQAGKNDFEKNAAAEQEKFLTALDASEDENDLNFFFKTMKRLTVRGYTSSEYFMTNVQQYKMIPGKYKGCVPVVAA
jgi:hypothetical protein